MSQNDSLRAEVFPVIYSGYPTLLNAIYSANNVRTSEQERDFLKGLQEPAAKLLGAYQEQDLSVDYLRTDYQSIYLLRYFFQNSLIIPSILYYHLKDWCYFEDELLTASFFGCGPGSEIYGLMHYLNKTYPNIVRISAAMLDRTSTAWQQYLCSYPSVAFTGWRYSRQIVFNHFLNTGQNPNLYAIADFKSNFDEDIRDLLCPASSTWVTKSDLICFQFCLNEVPESRYQQLITNLKYIVNIMKHGALMLIVEPPYKRVKKLLENLQYELGKEFNNNIEIRQKPDNDSSYVEMDLNLSYVPPELQAHLFLKERKALLATSIKYRWLAVSKG
ncbi:hypothetical protein F4X10_17985 [Candidatus Poribacteria bacterium]|nr:hypothetical protein [Candidatus Poribacteria bacterium]